MSVVPVFLYHAVSDDSPSWLAQFTVSPRTFMEHLDMIADSGLRVIPLRRLVAALLGGPPVPPRCAVLTFDDGYADFASTVAPLLAARGLGSTLYVTTGALSAAGRRRAADRSRPWRRSAGPRSGSWTRPGSRSAVTP